MSAAGGSCASPMVAQATLTGLYVALPAYFTLMVAAGVGSVLTSRRRRQKSVSSGPGEDALSAHFIAGRSLGALVTAATLFASLFSGYTVVGVPNEAFARGWTALRWVPGVGYIVLGYVCVGPRLRKCFSSRYPSSCRCRYERNLRCSTEHHDN